MPNLISQIFIIVRMKKLGSAVIMGAEGVVPNLNDFSLPKLCNAKTPTLKQSFANTLTWAAPHIKDHNSSWFDYCYPLLNCPSN